MAPHSKYVTTVNSPVNKMTYTLTRQLPERKVERHPKKGDSKALQPRPPMAVRREVPRKSVLETAQQWKALLGCPGSSNKADLALVLGVSRARVSQVLSVLDAPEPVQAAVRQADARGTIVTERLWRTVRRLPERRLVERLLGIGGERGEGTVGYV